MHFFNPVAVLPLVELVRTPLTDDVTLATAWDVTGKLRKRGVLVRDAPAFVVNRLLGRQGSIVTSARPRQLGRRDGRGGAPARPPDGAVGAAPAVGPKVANHVRHTLHDAWPSGPPPRRSRASRKEASRSSSSTLRKRSKIHEAVLEALADEVRHILEDGVVSEAADVDTCLILGAGFPFWLGGITKHLDQTGVSQRVVGRPLAELAVPASSPAP